MSSILQQTGSFFFCIVGRANNNKSMPEPVPMSSTQGNACASMHSVRLCLYHQCTELSQDCSSDCGMCVHDVEDIFFYLKMGVMTWSHPSADSIGESRSPVLYALHRHRHCLTKLCSSQTSSLQTKAPTLSQCNGDVSDAHPSSLIELVLTVKPGTDYQTQQTLKIGS